ncbi:unnamed protein product [Strongylus vulgaris]|uniref:Uncharacterized protein n=1 Tax=Strongylus vulgaris TaxID=40348 RepID=A0A3P7IMD5_STRVU|nr:unnamed protein product [Strongylus vulgaris]
MTKGELATYGWTVLPPPPCSSDLAPSDYHLFFHLQHLDCKTSTTATISRMHSRLFSMACPQPSRTRAYMAYPNECRRPSMKEYCR